VRSRPRAALPANATTGNQDVVLNSVSCLSARDCTAVGSYRDSGGNDEAMALTETAGAWAAGVEVSLPANTAASPIASLSSVSCASVGDCAALGTFAQAGRPGAYHRVLRAGEIAAGDRIEVVSRPSHGVTSALVSRALLGEPQLLTRALNAPELPAELHGWMRERRQTRVPAP
jgi:hypothetical protein